MKDTNHQQQESFVLRRGLKWVLIPQDRDNCHLLRELCGDDPLQVSVSWEDWPTLADALRNIREVAAGLNVSVSVCGNHKRSPTIILRRKVRDSMQPEPAFAEQRINLKWCVFSENKETWQECGYADTLEALGSLCAGQWLKIVSSPSKEGRSASVTVQKVGASTWRIKGVITDAWDEVSDLADTMGVLLVEQLAPEDGVLPEDEDEQLRFLAAYNERHKTAFKAVMDESQFRSAVPFSAAAMGPGLDYEFDRKVRGGVDRLIKALSDLEDDLIKQASDAWSGLVLDDADDSI